MNTTNKPLKVKDIFGKLKLIKFEKSTEEILKEVDEELDSKFFRDDEKD